MPKITRRTIAKSLCAALAVPIVGRASAQGAGAYPPAGQTLKVIVPYPAGGATDVVGRIVADRLSALWNVPLIVENVAGAASNIGTDRVAKGPADGTQILIVTPQIAINQFLYAKLAFDPEKDIVPIAQVARLPNILVVKKALGESIKTVKDLIDYAKANPGKLNYASSGAGSTIHLSAEMFKRRTGTDMVHVAYRGSAPAVNDLVAGHVDLMFDNATSIIGQVRSGTVGALGITSATRSALLPDLPPIADTVPGFDTAAWFGIGVRSETPEPIIDKIEQSVLKVMQEAVVKERLANVITDAAPSDRRTFGAWVVGERKKWGDLIRELKITAQ
ncbi:MAG: tripartite tricarboxylate transporter substrate binding protein [Hyphomicrobiaceae bacterium]|nr:MAG: tripartite tricarboxylate transporter substrate binding protein [Hyphomicrobiaceae bacterium]